MPDVHCNLYRFLILILCFEALTVRCVNVTKYAEKIKKLQGAARNLTNSMGFGVVVEVRTHCVQMQCNFVCFNGKSMEIPGEINKVMAENDLYCENIAELRLYNYEFPNRTIQPEFLGDYTRRVQTLYVASSNVSNFEAGAFGGGIYEQLYFENLQLTELRKDFFEDIASSFHALTVIQKNTPIPIITTDFLDNVKYKIKYLSLQVGISSVHNITCAGNVLNNLAYVDLSFNNFGGTLTHDVFRRLSVLEHLDLSYSNISCIPEYIFADFTDTLVYLNLAGNKLITIYRTIFGYRDIPRDLKIYAEDNPWECTCALQHEMKTIFAYYSTVFFCETPEVYRSWSVFDERICGSEEESGLSPESNTEGASFLPIVPITTVRPSTPNGGPSTKTTLDDFTGDFDSPNAGNSTETVLYEFTATTEASVVGDIVSLECQSTDNGGDSVNWQKLKWPSLKFHVNPLPSLSVAIRIESEGIDDSYGLMWFSKVSTQFYKMETNYNEYGLGCYGSIAYTTTVTDLLPDVAYTFCLVIKNERTMSPFSCKSVHVGSNLQVSYTAWLTRDMRATGISVAVLSIVMFTFLGISVVFLIVKRKPTLIKGSKRVALTKSGKDEIVVFPRKDTKKSIQQREEMIANRYSKSIQMNRYDSMDSIDSNQSYMNTNLYEVIPAYLKLNEEHLTPPSLATSPADDDGQPESYLPPLHSNSSSANLVSYAEIPYRSKRISNDPLPEVPTKDSQCLHVAEKEPAGEEHADNVSVYYARINDSRV